MTENVTKFKVGDIVTFSDHYKFIGETNIGFSNPLFRVVVIHNYIGIKLINKDTFCIRDDNGWRDYFRNPNGMNFIPSELKLANTCKLRKLREQKKK